jgi:hypothetical protein
LSPKSSIAFAAGIHIYRECLDNTLHIELGNEEIPVSLLDIIELREELNDWVLNAGALGIEILECRTKLLLDKKERKEELLRRAKGAEQR